MHIRYFVGVHRISGIHALMEMSLPLVGEDVSQRRGTDRDIFSSDMPRQLRVPNEFVQSKDVAAQIETAS